MASRNTLPTAASRNIDVNARSNGVSRSTRQAWSARAAASCVVLGLVVSATPARAQTTTKETSPKGELGASWSVEDGYSLDVLAEGFALPTSLAAVDHPNDDPHAAKLFVTELRGVIKVIANDNSISEFAKVTTFTPKIDWPDDEGEAGMAGICLDDEHGYVFATYAYRDANGIMRNGISRFTAQPHSFQGPAQDQRDLGQFLVNEPSAFSHQIGNCTVHGGLLYVSVGDAGNPALSAKVESPLGKVLRLTLDGQPVPENPFPNGANVAPRVFVVGLRNPFGLTFAGDRLFIAENGVSLDRFLEVRGGHDYHWDGSDASIATNAAAVFVPTIGPVQTIHVPPGPSPLADSDQDRFLIAASDGRQGPGVVVVDYNLTDNMVLRAPHHLVHYDGTQEGVAVTGIAMTKDGVCFVPILPVGGKGVVLVTRYRPEAAHNRIIGKTTIAGDLLSTSGCLGCHSRDGVGAHVGPNLDINSLLTRLETRLLNSEYAAQVAKLDTLTDEAVVSGEKARHEVLAAGPQTRVRTWIINRLLNPKFDNPDAQMPNLNLTREKAEAITNDLLGVSEPPKSKLRQLLTDRHFWEGAGSGMFGAATAGALLWLMLRRSKRARPETQPSAPAA
jgi:glucose/arabinose dehydrogenase